MRLTSACLALSFLAGGIFATAPAQAGDLSNDGAGGIKDYGSGGVPAPMPQVYQETYKWYLRGDVGTALKSQGTIGQGGLPIAFTEPENWNPMPITSFGFGRYITPSLRLEYTLDYRTQRQIASNGQSVSTTVAGTSTPILDPVTSVQIGNATPVNAYTGTQNDSITYQNTTLLMSAFYDFNREGRFHPYVGAGAGIAVHQLTLNGTATYNCSGFNSFVVDTYASTSTTLTGQPCSSSGLVSSFNTSANANAIGYGLAGQLSAGLSYDLSSRIHWDTGYRMLWQSGHLAVSSSDGLSSLHLNNITDHEIRTGVRWDIW